MSHLLKLWMRTKGRLKSRVGQRALSIEQNRDEHSDSPGIVLIFDAPVFLMEEEAIEQSVCSHGKCAASVQKCGFALPIINDTSAQRKTCNMHFGD